MFDIGFIEIMIVSMVALIVIGPERLPHVARTAGHLLGRLRQYVSSVKNDIQNEIRLEELRSMHASIKEATDSIENSVRQEVDQLKSMTETSSTTTPSSASGNDETDAGIKSQAGITDTSKPQSSSNLEKQRNHGAKSN